MKDRILSEIAEAIIKGQRETAVKGVIDALNQGISPQRILIEGIAKGMEIVGYKLKKQEYFLLELFVSEEAARAAREKLEPYLEREGINLPVVVIGTAYHDLHNLGKDIVAMSLQGAGFRVIDLGVDVPPERFVEKVKEANADILAISCLMVTCRDYIKDVIKALKEHGIRGKVKVLIGGLAISQRFADTIGADAYAEDAVIAVETAKKLIKK